MNKTGYCVVTTDGDSQNINLHDEVKAIKWAKTFCQLSHQIIDCVYDLDSGEVVYIPTKK